MPDVRPGLISRYRELGIDSGIEVPVRCLGFSLSDCYWLRPVNCDELDWQHLNYFENDFERSAPEQRSGWLEGIGLKNPDNTSEGELPKSWMIRNGVRILVKGNHELRASSECRVDAAVHRGGDARVLRLPQHGNARLLELPKNSLCMLATAVIDDDDPGNLRVERGAVCDECRLGAKRREHRDDSRTVRPATGRR